MQIKDRVFIVTGGASGLGEGTARMLAAEGGKVVIADMQADKGEAVAREIGGAARDDEYPVLDLHGMSPWLSDVDVNVTLKLCMQPRPQPCRAQEKARQCRAGDGRDGGYWNPARSSICWTLAMFLPPAAIGMVSLLKGLPPVISLSAGLSSSKIGR